MNFFDKFCDVNKLEELEMDTNSLYLALAEDLCECFFPVSEQNGMENKARIAETVLEQAQKRIFPRTCCSKVKKCDKNEL